MRALRSRRRIVAVLNVALYAEIFCFIFPFLFFPSSFVILVSAYKTTFKAAKMRLRDLSARSSATHLQYLRKKLTLPEGNRRPNLKFRGYSISYHYVRQDIPPLDVESVAVTKKFRKLICRQAEMKGWADIFTKLVDCAAT